MLKSKNQQDWIIPNTILLVESGSHAYGTNTKKSDKDYKGIALPPLKQFYLGSDTFESVQITTGEQTSKNTKEDIDLTIYSIKRFFKLAEQADPSMLEMLFVDPSSILINTKHGQAILENRHLFLTNQLIKRFGGFAFQSRKRIERDLAKNNNYDTKTLMNAIRLYETATQALETGVFETRRKNADELLAVRNGRHADTLFDVLDHKEKLFNYAAEHSVLPKKPNHKEIQQLLINLTSDFFDINKKE